MKKLMIAAAVVCAAVFANAATCSWKTEWIYAVDTSHSTYTDGGFTGKYWILGGDFSDVSVGAGGVLSAKGEYTTYVDGVALTGSDGIGDDITGLTSADNTKALAMIVYYNGADGEYWGMDASRSIAGIVDPDPGSGVTGSDAMPVAFFTFDDGEYKCMGATTEVVPEPTSGLLLLLGVAGLALRRRRA